MIKIKNAHKSFGKTEVLKGIDFSLKKGEVVALLGDNGAGKSTFIKCLCGFDKFDKTDEFSIFGKEIDKKRYSLKESRKLGIEVVFQENSLGLEQEIYRNIFANRHITKFGLIDRKKEIAITNEILKNFLGFNGKGLNATTKALNLSGGEKQGLCIARAIHFNSKVLILDEPTTALGINEAAKFMGFLKKLKQKGMSVIIITHNLNQAFNIGDKFVLLRDGLIKSEFLKEEISSLDALYKAFYE
ncbi:monosaccharide ABC transporter, ATP-binding protein [Campylobacter blaseri]|uniref:ABC transporter ATP-binding protein n=1 Tax=Campylobacter blaseri TaxID=2042961 RepID=A0A2P8R137_9BACT|nr:ATP-binding cassette domain-containing protein [Campylobacter blaseri]PSM52212.1 ABC transporter ATP-binding protein [Campylobacter blaseri]PSM53978.1 ABC transporter ATP-binding protein [Campylobacter blaseri]QKF85416.1 monosaccharide ABC transporter, ATP-binding protein [Campylobacter blaseri]